MAEEYRRIRFTPSNKYLGNPHKGCCTFQHFNGDPLFPDTWWSEEGPTTFDNQLTEYGGSGLHQRKVETTPGYLPSTVAYCRWFWDLLEPKKGEYNWAIIDEALQTAAKRKQTLAVRLMAFGAMTQPQLPQWYLDTYACKVQTIKSNTWKQADHDSDDYLTHWGGFIKAFAKRYDSNPSLESIDITYIGPWGEGDGECSPKRCDEFAQLWQDAFPNTQTIALIEGEQFKAGIAHGSGWRCDCFGDLREGGSDEVACHESWNHTFDAYPRSLCLADATENWKQGPVHLETCWVPEYWHRTGYDIDLIIEQGLKNHATYFMPKYTKLPDAWMGKLADFCKKLGYRFVLRQIVHHTIGTVGKAFSITSWIENVGVAPLYKEDYHLALRFRQKDRSEIISLDSKPTSWMPGDSWLEEEVTLPTWLETGICELSVAIVDKNDVPRIRFAVQERYSDNWVPLQSIGIENN